MVARNPGSTQSEIAHALGTTPQNISGSLYKLLGTTELTRQGTVYTLTDVVFASWLEH